MIRRLLVASIVAAAVMVVPVTFASAGDQVESLDIELVSPVEPLTFRLEIIEASCDTGTFDVLIVETNGADVTPISVTEDAADPNVALIVLPSNTTPGELFVSATCLNGEFPQVGDGTELFSAMAVTKTVVGPAPAAATFTVNANCLGALDAPPVVKGDDVAFAEVGNDFAVNLVFGASGGLKYVYSDHAVECTITEPVNGGATTTTITPAVVVHEEPAAYASTVTNTFAAVIQPTFTG